MNQQIEDVNLAELACNFNIDIDAFQKHLEEIWNELGIDEHTVSEKRAHCFALLQNTMKNILSQELEFTSSIREDIHNHQKKLEALSKALKVEVPFVETGSGLIEHHDNLNDAVISLKKLKQERLNEYKHLKEIEDELCSILGLHVQPPSQSEMLNKDFLANLSRRIKILADDIATRRTEFQLIKGKILVLIEETDFKPETELQSNILWGKKDTLSDATMQLMRNMLCQAKETKDSLEDQKQKLLSKISVLWQRLGKEQTEVDDFLSEHKDCHPCTLSRMEEELLSCEQIKKDNMEIFVANLQTELEYILNKCDVPEHLRLAFQSAKAVNTDEYLQELEDEVEKWKQYYSRTESIYQKIGKWEELLQHFLELEDKATDPNRFKNRKGNLLKEEKERKKVQRDLPALENDIFRDIDGYQEESDIPFSYKGTDFRIYAREQLQKMKEQKENYKRLKVPNSSSPGPAVQTPKQNHRRELRSASFKNSPQPLHLKANTRRSSSFRYAENSQGSNVQE